MARSYTLTKKLKLINQHTKNVGGEKILEYGCGTGEFVNTCKSNDWMVSGVEPSLTARTKAQELTQQKIHSSLKELDAKDFHAITLWHVLEHVPDLENIVEKLTSKLKKDGTMFIAVPNHESYDAKYYGNIWAAYDVPRHLWHFSRKNITMLMERNGLRLKTITPMKLDSFYVSMLSESYRNNSASSISNFLKAMWIGMKSNQKAATSGNYSSLIYIFTK